MWREYIKITDYFFINFWWVVVLSDYIKEFSRNFYMGPLNTALVVVDLQYATGSRTHGLGKLLKKQGRIVEADYRFSRIDDFVVPNTKKLIKTFRNLDAKIIFLTYGSQRDDCLDISPHIRSIVKETNNIKGHREHDILSEIYPIEGDLVLNKVTMGAFASTGIESRLRAMCIENIVAVGVSTNNCLGMTAMEAADRGFGVALVSDASGTCDDDSQKSFEEMFLRLWGRVVTTDGVISEMNKENS